jgi:hypothetical protein
MQQRDCAAHPHLLQAVIQPGAYGAVREQQHAGGQDGEADADAVPGVRHAWAVEGGVAHYASEPRSWRFY